MKIQFVLIGLLLCATLTTISIVYAHPFDTPPVDAPPIDTPPVNAPPIQTPPVKKDQ